jgi:rRNA processing protein Krr1/Pno1
MPTPKPRATRYGPVNATVLAHLQQTLDTHRLFDAVDAIDRLRDRICGAQGMRDELLRLHAMAHVLINGGTAVGGPPPTEAIWEVADGLARRP